MYTDEKHLPLPGTPEADLILPTESSTSDGTQQRPAHSRLRLIVLAGVLIYFVVGFGGHALKLATEDYGYSHTELDRARCPSQPDALGKGDEWVGLALGPALEGLDPTY